MCICFVCVCIAQANKPFSILFHSYKNVPKKKTVLAEMKSKDLGNLCIWGVLGEGSHFLTMPKYLRFRDLTLKKISSLTRDLKKLI